MLMTFCRSRVCSQIFKADQRILISVCRRDKSTFLLDIPAEKRQTIINDDDKGVRRVTLNNIKTRNALSHAMLKELQAVLLQSAEDEKVKVIIMGHTGPVFSAGHNLKELQSSTGRSYHEDVFDECAEMMKIVQDIPIPVIAEVKGVAAAAGCQLVSTCDMAVCSHESSFSVPGVSIGLFCSTPAVALSRSIHRKHALQMLFTGDPITAEEALSYGLVNNIVPEEDVEATTQNLAERITRHSRMVIGLGKKGFYKQITENRDKAYEVAGKCIVDNLQFDDAQEGIQAFFGKRKPIWKSES